MAQNNNNNKYLVVAGILATFALFSSAAPNSAAAKFISNRRRRLGFARYQKNGLLLDTRSFVPWSKPHPVVISLTTSPARIRFLKQIFDGIDGRTFDHICLNLPDVYKPTGEKYTIPNWMHTYPKLVINTFGEDLGPISKLVPTIKRFPNAFVITIDDDTLYKRYFVNCLGHMYDNVANAKNTVFAQHGVVYNQWTRRNENKHFDNFCFDLLDKRARKHTTYSVNQLLHTKYMTLHVANLVEGFGGVMYPPGVINPEELESLSKTSKKCFLSDDMTISVYLALKGKQKIGISKTRFEQKNFVKQLPYGFQADALHNQQNHFMSYSMVLRHLYTIPKTIQLYENCNCRKFFSAVDLVNELRKSSKNIIGASYPYLDERANSQKPIHVFDFDLQRSIINNDFEDLYFVSNPTQLKLILPHIMKTRQPFYILTLSNETSKPSPLSALGNNQRTVNEILLHPFLQKWITVNADQIHPKIVPLPIGINWMQLEDENIVQDFLRLHSAVFSSTKAKSIKMTVTEIDLLLDNARHSKNRLLFWKEIADKILIENHQVVVNVRQNNKQPEISHDHSVLYEILALQCTLRVACSESNGMYPMFQKMISDFNAPIEFLQTKDVTGGSSGKMLNCEKMFDLNSWV
jgi:hypothetical protein